MASIHFLSSEIVPPINFTWTGDVSISFGDSTFAILVLVVALIIWYKLRE